MEFITEVTLKLIPIVLFFYRIFLFKTTFLTKLRVLSETKVVVLLRMNRKFGIHAINKVHLISQKVDTDNRDLTKANCRWFRALSGKKFDNDQLRNEAWYFMYRHESTDQKENYHRRLPTTKVSFIFDSP